MSTYDPDSGVSYRDWLCNKGVQTNTGRARPVRREIRDEAGHMVREVTELTDSGAVATTRNRSSKQGEHQDVHVHVPTVHGAVGVLHR